MIILRQKQYGLRDKLINKLNNSLSKDQHEINQLNYDLTHKHRKGLDLKEEYKVIRAIRKIGKNEGRSKIVGDRRPEQKVPEINIPFNKSGHFRNLIYYNPDHGAGGVAHEIGHSLEREQGSMIGKAINRLSDNARVGIKRDAKNSGIITTAKQFIRGKLINLNEKRANNQGINLLRKVQAKPELINKKQAGLNNTLRNHIVTNNMIFKQNLLNTLNKKK